MSGKGSENSRANQTILQKWFEIGTLPKSLQRISFIYITINLLFSFGFHATDTFLTLYLLEKISWTKVSIIFSIQIATQLLFDYPTGALGDYIGQRAVLVGAFFLKIASLVFLFFANNLGLLVVYAFFAGLGNSQLSGALDSWFDSNYRTLSEEIDVERKIYSRFTAKLYSSYLAIAGIACLISGAIGMLISRNILFIIEIFIYIIILIIIIRFISPIQQGFSRESKNKSKINQYFEVFKKGLRFAFSKPTLMAFFIGYAIFNGFMDGVWTKLILFPYYNSYLVTDFNTGLFRWGDLTIDIFLVLLLKKIPANAKKPRKGYIISLLGILGGLIVFMLYYLLFPPSGAFTIWEFLKLFSIGFTLGIPYRLTFLFFARMIIDLVPNDIRNSVYSLLPTLTLIINIPAALLGGKLLGTIGIPYTILVIIGSCTLGVLLQAYGLKSLRKKSQVEKLKKKTN